MRRTIVRLSVLAVILPLFVDAAFGGDPAGTAFTYQGHLKQGGVPVSGTCSFGFGLWDDPVAGGPPLALTKPGVEVVNGLFTVDLDFGSEPFEGDARWLEIWVCCRGPGDPGAYCSSPPTNFTLVGPRQELTPVPYALYAATGGDSSLWRLNGTSVYYKDGKVGIGTSDPDYKLDIVGSSNSFRVGNANSWLQVSTGGNTRLSLGDGAGNEAGYILGGHNASGDNVVKITGCTDAGSCPGSTTFLQNGNVGIGQSAPSAKLDVNGSVKVAGRTIYASGTGPLITAGHNNTAGFEKRMWIGHSQVSPNWGIQYRDLASDGLYADSIEFVAGDTTRPRFSLQLSNGILRMFDPNVQETVWINPNAGGGGAGVLLFNSAGQNTIELDADEGDDGVIRLLDAAGNTGVSLLGDGAAGVAGRITVRNDDGYATVDIYGAEGAVDNGGQILLRKADGTVTIELDAEWGANGPGRIRVQVVEITGGADLSEQFDVNSSEAEPGTVVCIDPAHPGELTVCSRSYDRTVAGVISGAGGVRPGLLMSQEGSAADGEHPVALTGRVHVRADASNGAIQPGDLLTTSGTSGHAMKVTDYGKAQGAILGKAMTTLETGRGLVLVLVSLQ